MEFLQASMNPSKPTVDQILQDAMKCANAGIATAGNIVRAGTDMYNAVNGMMSPQQPQSQPQPSYQYGMTPPPVRYPYGEMPMNGYNSSFMMRQPTNQWANGYPGFADPEYGRVNRYQGYYGGNL